MKVILNYDKSTGQITDSLGTYIAVWMGLNYEEIGDEKDMAEKEAVGNNVDGEQMIRIMKIAAYVSEPDKIAKI